MQKESALSEDTIQFYQYWKEKYLTKDEYVKDDVQYYVYYSEEHYNGGEQSVPVTVSEAHGYGMLITVQMAAYDSDAKNNFDGMYRYFKAHPSDIGSHLMSWQQSDNGTALIDGATDGSMTEAACDAATDGDLDIAYALLLADTVWGSDGAIDYRSEAIAVLQDIMTYEVNTDTWTLTLGDWVSECNDSDPYRSAVRCSDFILQYFPVFAEATGDDNWQKVYDATYAIIAGLTASHETGLLPDFAIRAEDGTYIPASAYFLESESDGDYSYNSCRTPWRIGVDGLMNNNEMAKRWAETLSTFMKTQTGADPWEVKAGYTLDGTAIADYNELCFVAPLLIAAKCGTDTQWHDAIRTAILEYGEDVYYGDTIKLLCLIVDDDGWMIPKTASSEQKGDVNADGKMDLSDVIALQKWLLVVSGASLENWEAGDFYPDQRLNVFDLSLMKRELLTSWKE